MLAIARKTVVALHAMLSASVNYTQPGADHRRRVDAERYERKLIERVEALGFDVTRRADTGDGQAS